MGSMDPTHEKSTRLSIGHRSHFRFPTSAPAFPALLSLIFFVLTLSGSISFFSSSVMYFLHFFPEVDSACGHGKRTLTCRISNMDLGRYSLRKKSDVFRQLAQSVDIYGINTHSSGGECWGVVSLFPPFSLVCFTALSSSLSSANASASVSVLRFVLLGFIHNETTTASL